MQNSTEILGSPINFMAMFLPLIKGALMLSVYFYHVSPPFPQWSCFSPTSART